MDDLPTRCDESTRVTHAEVTSKAPLGPLPSHVGRYMVIELLGRGGMGVVLRAYDPRLQREVALKKLVSVRDSEPSRARMVREARAMARLSHPNVVAVYDVETVEDEVVIAMELVEGQPLSRWLREPRSWEEIVRIFAASGRALVAAHAQGLLHRDFKPANVIVRDDGRPQVTDFGLARAAAIDASEPASVDEGAAILEASVDTSLTMDGTVVGTPAYMAPECHMGAELTAAVDQYAFCVALWSALTGTLLFPQPTVEDLARAKLEGPPPWPSGRRVPARIVDALRRGLQPKPEDRWPSMSALLARLEPSPARLGLGWMLGGLGVLGLGGGLWLLAREPARCTGAEEAIADAWGPSRRAEVEASLSGVPRSYAPAVAQWTVEHLDAYADAWIEGHRDACEASTVRGEQSPAMMDLRMACLARARQELATASELLASEDQARVDRAEAIVGGLAPPQRCADVIMLSAAVPPPDDPAAVEAVERIRGGLAAIDVRLRADDHDEAEVELVTLETEAGGIDYPPLRTELLLRRGSLEEGRGHYPEAVKVFEEVVRRSLRWGQWREAWRAENRLTWVVGYQQEEHDAALVHAEIAMGLLPRLGDDVQEEESSTRSNRGQVLRAMGRLDDAEVEQRRALELYRAAKGADHPGQAYLLNNLATVLQDKGQYDEAEQIQRRTLAMWAERFSLDYPDACISRGNLGVLLKKRGRMDEAEAELRAVVDSYERTLGPDHPRLIRVLHNLSNVLREQGRYDEAEQILLREIELASEHYGPEHVHTATARGALALILKARGRNEEAEQQLRQSITHTTAALGPEHPRVANLRGNLANVLKNLGRMDEAEAELREVLALERAAMGPKHPRVAGTVHNLANLLALAEQTDEAIELFEQAVALREELLGPSHHLLAMSLAGLGSARLDQGEVEQAVESLSRAWSIVEEGGSPRDRARVAFALARARWEQGQDRADARELARSAQQWFIADAGPEHAETLEVGQWLAEHE